MCQDFPKVSWKSPPQVQTPNPITKDKRWPHGPLVDVFFLQGHGTGCQPPRPIVTAGGERKPQVCERLTLGCFDDARSNRMWTMYLAIFITLWPHLCPPAFAPGAGYVYIYIYMRNNIQNHLCQENWNWSSKNWHAIYRGIWSVQNPQVIRSQKQDFLSKLNHLQGRNFLLKHVIKSIAANRPSGRPSTYAAMYNFSKEGW